jgi:hypothetical protein
MDGITLEQFESVFGRLETSLFDSNERFQKKFDVQTTTLNKLQNFLGQKIDSVVEYQKTVAKKIELLNDFAKKLVVNTKSTEKSQASTSVLKSEQKDKKEKVDTKDDGISGIKLITSGTGVSSSLKLLPIRIVEDEKKKKGVDVFFPPETKVWIENLLGDTIKDLFDAIKDSEKNKSKDNKKDEKKGDKKDWLEKLLGGSMLAGMIGKLLSTLFSPIKHLLLKPIEFIAKKILGLIPKVLGEIAGKLIMPLVRGVFTALGPILLGIGGVAAGVMTLISGLQDSGPMKGTKKLLGKGLLDIGANIIKKEFGKLSKMVMVTAKDLSKESRKFVFKAMGGLRKVLKYIKNIPSKLFGGITDLLKNVFSGGAIKEVSEVAAKGAGKGGFKAILGNIGKFLSEKVLKRLPFIGTLIGLGFAFTRLMKGDVVGALLDVASALATSVPVVGTALSIAIDVFSAVRDVKTGGSEKAGKANMGWIEGAKKWISERIKYVPVIGPLIDMVKALGEGKYLDALGYLGKSIPLVGIIVDLFEHPKEVASATKTGINWIGSLTKWLYSKIKYVPIIGPLIGAVEAMTEGNWRDVFKLLTKAALPELGIIMDLLENKQAIGETVKSTVDVIGGVSKWLFDRFKYVPVFGPLMGMVESITKGEWLDALGYLAKAAIPPLGILVDILDNKEAIGNAVTSTIDVVGQMSSWLYAQARGLPVIGGLIKAGEAIGSGKWGDVLGYLGEAIEPLQYIGGLIANTIKPIAIDATGGVTDFFKEISNQLLRAVLDMVPDIKIGTWSLKKSVAGILGISETGSTSTTPPFNLPPKAAATVQMPPTATEQKTPVTNNTAKVINQPADTFTRMQEDANKDLNTPDDVKYKRELMKIKIKQAQLDKYKSKHADADEDMLDRIQAQIDARKENLSRWAKNKHLDNTDTGADVDTADSDDNQPVTSNVQATDNKQLPNIQPTEAPVMPKQTEQEENDGDNNADEMSDSLKEHSNLLKGLIEYNKQTAANTKALIAAFMKNQSNQTNMVNNISKPTMFISGPASNSSFRQAALQ